MLLALLALLSTPLATPQDATTQETTVSPAPAATAKPAAARLAAKAENRGRIAVAEFRVEGGADATLAGSIADVLAIELEKFEGVELLTRNDVRAVLSTEAENQLLGCEDAACFVDVSKLLPTRHILTGTVNKLGGALIVEAALIDLVDVRVTARASATVAGGSDDIAAALKTVALGLVTGDAALLPATATVRGEVDAAMLDRVRIAQRTRGPAFSLLGGVVFSTTFALGEPSDPAYPGGAGKLVVDVPLLPWLNATGFADGGYYVGRFVNLATFIFPAGTDIESSNGAFVADYAIGIAELGAGVKVQTPTGFARPFASLGVTGGIFTLDVSDLVYQRQAGQPDLPPPFSDPVPFQQSIAVGAGVDVATGVAVAVFEHVAVTLELDAYGKLHGLEKIFLEENVEQRQPLAPLVGMMLFIGASYEL